MLTSPLLPSPFCVRLKYADTIIHRLSLSAALDKRKNLIKGETTPASERARARQKKSASVFLGKTFHLTWPRLIVPLLLPPVPRRLQYFCARFSLTFMFDTQSLMVHQVQRWPLSLLQRRHRFIADTFNLYSVCHITW